MYGWALIILDKKAVCYHVLQLQRQFTIGNTVFNEYDDSDFTGFYEWLKNPMEEVISLRYIRLSRFDPVALAALKRLPYVNFRLKNIIEIFFTTNRDYVDGVQYEQDLGICKMYASSDLTFAILVDIQYLSSEEFMGLAL